MADDFATKEHVALKIEERATAERKLSDGLYAPMLTKTLIFSVIGTAAAGVLLGTINAFTGNFIQSFQAPQHNIQAYDETE